MKPNNKVGASFVYDNHQTLVVLLNQLEDVHILQAE